jgi:hypothetical protein
MHITAYSFGDRREFYCYLKDDSGRIAESIGSGFIRALFKALLKLWRTETCKDL